MLLVVLVESGAAAYFGPVGLRWLAEPAGFDWRIATTDMAAERLPLEVRESGRIVGRIDRTNPEAGAEALDRFRPSALLASAAGWPAEIGGVRAAARNGIRTVQFVDTWSNYRRRFTDPNADVPVWPERVLVIDERAVAEAATDGIPNQRLRPVGHPVWEDVEALTPSDRRRTLFIGAPVARDYGRDLGYDETDCWNLLCLARQQEPGLFETLSYAPHPEQASIDLDTETCRYDLGMLKTEVDQVLGIFSAPLTDAFLAGRRSVSLQPGAVGRDMWPLSRFGLAPRATSVDELLAALKLPPADPSPLRHGLCDSKMRFTEAVREIVCDD